MNLFVRSFIILPVLFISIGLSSASAQEPQTDAVYTSVAKEYTLNTDGSWDYHYSHTLKLLTYYAFHSLYGEDFIIYNPRYQKLKINRSVTTMADGTKVPGPENAFNELLPGFAANAPAFNHLREMAVTHTGLERGAIIDFDYVLTSSKEYSTAMTGNEALWMNSPIEKLTFIIHVPKGVGLNVSQYNIVEKPVIIRESGRTTYTWSLSDLPAATREDFRSREQQNRPRIVFSTAKNSNKLFQSFLAQPAFALTCDESMKNRIDGILNEKKNSEITMLSIQDLVANEVNYHQVPIASAGFRVRPAEDVYKSNGGNEAEKAVLLATMLKAAGIPAEPVAILPERFFDSNSSNLFQIERFLVKAMPGNSDPYYLSPLQNDLYEQRFTLSGKKLVLLVQGKNLEMDKEPASNQDIELTGNLALDDKMILTGKVTVALTGRFNPYLKLSLDSSYAQKMIAGVFERPEIKTFTLGRLDRDKTTAEYSVSSSEKVKEQAEHYFLKIPAISSGIEGWHMAELVSKRTEPLELPFHVNESYHFTITLPEDFELITAETNLNINKDFGNLRIEIAQNGRTLQVDKMIVLTKTLVGPSEYDDFKNFINTWNNRKYREIIIRKGPK